MAFAYYKSITVDHTQAGAADSSNFPLTIALDGNVQAADADLKTVSNGGFVQSASGFDIRPYSDSGLTTALTFELVTYDATTGKLEMHIKLPTLSHTADTVIYLAFGDATITTDGSSTATWDSNYKAVYHLKDGTTLNLNDSTSNAGNLTNNSMTAGTGEIDGGAVLNGSAQYATLGSSPVTVFPMTFSIWAKTAVTAGVQTALIVENGTSTNANMIRLIAYQGFAQFQVQASSDSRLTNSSAGYSTTDWFYMVGTVATSDFMTVYLNGGNIGTDLGRALDPGALADNLSIGREASSGSEYFIGSLDEARISNIVRSADWVLAEYNNQKPASTMIAWGAKVANAAGPFWSLTFVHS